MDEITWQSPPPDHRKPRRISRWEPVANALRGNPGKWARIGVQINVSVVRAAAKGELVCFRPAGSFEGRCTNFTNRYTADVYLRYIGEHGEFKDIT